MKKLIQLFTLLLAVLLLTGCSGGGYKYLNRGENSYIRLDSAYLPTKTSNSSSSGSVSAPEVRFSTVAEMKQDIETGNFTEAELKQIGRFTQAGSNKVSVVSTSLLKDAVYPTRYSIDYILWRGSRYSFLLHDSTGSTVTIRAVSNAEYEKTMQQVFSESARADKLVSRQTNSAYRNARIDIFRTYAGQVKAAVYTIEDGDRTLHVIEHYEYDVLTYSPVPSSIEILIEQESLYVDVYISDPSSQLSIDELKSFGLRDYVETERS